MRYTIIFLALIGVLGLMSLNFQSKTTSMNQSSESIYDIKINSLQGEPINLSDFKGKKIMFVNVASKCGFTPQYAGLEELYEKYSDQLMIIGVPCNQFGGQEPGDNNEIATFCEKNYGVTFLMTEKVDVKGDDQHPLYTWLTSKDKNGFKNSTVKWNFQKYIVSESGELEGVYMSTVEPQSDKIISHLK